MKRYTLPVYIKGMVFAVILMLSAGSCCVTGYCQIEQNVPQQDMPVKEK